VILSHWTSQRVLRLPIMHVTQQTQLPLHILVSHFHYSNQYTRSKWLFLPNWVEHFIHKFSLSLANPIKCLRRNCRNINFLCLFSKFSRYKKRKVVVLGEKTIREKHGTCEKTEGLWRIRNIDSEFYYYFVTSCIEHFPSFRAHTTTKIGAMITGILENLGTLNSSREREIFLVAEAWNEGGLGIKNKFLWK